MRKIFSLVLILVIVFSCFSVSANALGVTRSIEHLADGSYYVIEITESNSLARTSKTGLKTATYYTASDIKVFTVQLTGTFTYTSGVSAAATSQSVNVILHQNSAEFISKSSRHSGATVYGSGTVSYLGYTTAKSVNLTCDIYGNLS